MMYLDPDLPCLMTSGEQKLLVFVHSGSAMEGAVSRASLRLFVPKHRVYHPRSASHCS